MPNATYLDIAGKTALVTGAGANMGQAIALALAEQGVTVLVTDRSAELISETISKIEAFGGTAYGFGADLSDLEEVEALGAAALKHLKQVDIFVSNAAFIDQCDIDEVRPEIWDKSTSVNTKAPFFLARTLAQGSSEHPASWIFISSIGATRSHYKSFPYDQSKAALESIVRSFAIQYAPHIRANAIAPGAVSRADFCIEDEEARRIPLHRSGCPEDIANAVLFLASQNSSYMTGHTLVIDGGLTVQIAPKGQWY